MVAASTKIAVGKMTKKVSSFLSFIWPKGCRHFESNRKCQGSRWEIARDVDVEPALIAASDIGAATHVYLTRRGNLAARSAANHS